MTDFGTSPGPARGSLPAGMTNKGREHPACHSCHSCAGRNPREWRASGSPGKRPRHDPLTGADLQQPVVPAKAGIQMAAMARSQTKRSRSGLSAAPASLLFSSLATSTATAQRRLRRTTEASTPPARNRCFPGSRPPAPHTRPRPGRTNRPSAIRPWRSTKSPPSRSPSRCTFR